MRDLSHIQRDTIEETRAAREAERVKQVPFKARVMAFGEDWGNGETITKEALAEAFSLEGSPISMQFDHQSPPVGVVKKATTGEKGINVEGTIRADLTSLDDVKGEFTIGGVCTRKEDGTIETFTPTMVAYIPKGML